MILKNQLTQTDAEGSTTSYTYDANNNVLTETHTRTVDGAPQTETTTFTYDKLNRVVSTLNALGHTTSTTFDLAGQQTATVDALSHRMEMDYNAYGRVIETRYEDGTHTNKTYDAEGNLKSETDRNRKTTSFTYDKLNRLTHTFYANSTSTETEYDDAGQVVAEIDANQNRTEFTYDLAGRRTQVKDAQQQTHNFTYDKNGNLKTETDALGHTTTYTYNNLDQKTTTTYHNTSVMEQGLDAMGRRASQTDQAEITTSYDYDKLGRLTSVTDIQGNVTSYTYDEMGNKLTQKDAENKTTTWTYDALGRVLIRTLPMLQSESFSYDNNGNMKTHIDFNGSSTSYDYDVSDRVILISYSDGNTEEFIYDDNGNQIGAIQTDSDNVERITSYTFDVMNRLTSETQATGAVLSYVYDNNGNKTKLTTVVNGNTRIEDYVYDSLNRLTSKTDNSGITTYGYDVVGNQTSINHADLSSDIYTYDNLNRLTLKETFNGSGALVESYSYTLGDTGIRTQIDELDGRSTSYGYNNLYRLLTENITDSINGDYSSEYEYDKVGNRTYETVNGVETQYDYDLNDRLLQQGGTIYTYDNNGSTLTETLDAHIKSFFYNKKNQLISVEDSSTALITDYAYNINGIRTSKASSGITTAFVVDENRAYAQVLQEVVDGSAIVFYNYGHDLLSQERNAEIYSYHYDGIGSTRTLTDSTGVVAATFDYEAFGEVLNETGNIENSYLWQGEQKDSETNNYYLRARYYNPNRGGFISQDTYMGDNYDPVTLHKYLGMNANPVSYTDPSGNFGLIEASAVNNIVGILTQLQVHNAFNVFDIMGVDDSGVQTAANINKLIGLAMLGTGGVQIAKLLSGRFRKACNSFDEETLVSAEFGLMPISEIKINDKVWAYNEETGEKSLQEVVHLIQGEGSKQLVDIVLVNGEIITATAGHPFYILKNKEWLAANELSLDDNLLGFNGDLLNIAGLKSYSKQAKVYNLTVDGNHTYYVGESRILSHNAGVCEFPPIPKKLSSKLKRINNQIASGGFRGVSGAVTHDEAVLLGLRFVGSGFKTGTARGTKTFTSLDGTRQFTFPSPKSGINRNTQQPYSQTGVQVNFETRPIGTKTWVNNVHLDIK